MAVIKLLVDKYTPVIAPTIFGELMKRLENVSGKSQCGNRIHKQNIAI